MTPNDEVNALAVREYAEVFDRSGVYRLPTKASAGASHERMGPSAAGRQLFDAETTFAVLVQREQAGAVVKKTKRSEEFDFAAWRARYGYSALVLFVLNTAGRLVVRTAEDTSDPTAGETVIGLVDPVEDPADAAQA